MADTMRTEAKVYFCGHCQQRLSKTLYFLHKKLYFDPKLKTWKCLRDAVIPAAPVEEFRFSDEDSEVGEEDVDGGKNF